MEKIKMNLKISDENLKSYSNELFNKIQNDSYYPELIKEGWTDLEIKNNVTKFNEYIEDLHFVEKIHTYEDCLKYNRNSRMTLVRRGKIIERDYVPLKPYLEQISYLKRFVCADFNDLPTNANIKLVTKTPKMAVWDHVKDNKWVFLKGGTRTGKSYVALSLLNYFYEKDSSFTFGFLNTIVRFKELNDIYYKDRADFNELINTYSEVDYLVLDGFGDEYKNEMIRDTILYPIILNRYAKRKTTIFTSRFSLSELTELYSFKKYSKDIIAERLFEMIKEMCDKEIDCGNLPIY